MRVCANIDCSFIRAGRRAAKFDDAAPTCTHCGQALSAPFAAEATAMAPTRTKELRGVPLESLGLAIGHWVPVKVGERITFRVGIGAIIIVGLIALGAFMATQPIVGAVMFVAAVVGAVWIAVSNPAAQVRLYDRGFELERGSQKVGIAFAKLESAKLYTTEHLANGIRIGWEYRLELAWDLGRVTLNSVEGRGAAEPSRPFYELAQHVVRTCSQ